jgi:predicted ArsR family transcriptional regulator
MARQGFEPQVRATPDGAEIVLHNCPFASTAVADRDTVCSQHLGIAQGLVGGTPVAEDELVAYDPRKAGCRLRLRVGTDVTGPDAGTLALRGRRKQR